MDQKGKRTQQEALDNLQPPPINLNISNVNTNIQKQTVKGAGGGGNQVYSNLSMMDVLGHFVIWLILIVCTVGVAFPFYFFGIIRTAINSSRLE